VLARLIRRLLLVIFVLWHVAESARYCRHKPSAVGYVSRALYAIDRLVADNTVALLYASRSPRNNRPPKHSPLPPGNWRVCNRYNDENSNEASSGIRVLS